MVRTLTLTLIALFIAVATYQGCGKASFWTSPSYSKASGTGNPFDGKPRVYQVRNAVTCAGINPLGIFQEIVSKDDGFWLTVENCVSRDPVLVSADVNSNGDIGIIDYKNSILTNKYVFEAMPDLKPILHCISDAKTSEYAIWSDGSSTKASYSGIGGFNFALFPVARADGSVLGYPASAIAYTGKLPDLTANKEFVVIINDPTVLIAKWFLRMPDGSLAEQETGSCIK